MPSARSIGFGKGGRLASCPTLRYSAAGPDRGRPMPRKEGPRERDSGQERTGRSRFLPTETGSAVERAGGTVFFGWGRKRREGASPRAGVPTVLWVGGLLGAEVRGPAGEHLGHLRDLGLTRTRGGPHVDTIVVDGSGYCFTLPAEAVTSWCDCRLRVHTARRPSARSNLSIQPQRERLADAVLGRPVLTTPAQTGPVRVSDVGLRRDRDGRWVVWLIDTRPAWLRRLGFPRRVTPWTVPTRRCVIRRPGRSTRPGSAATAATTRTRDGRPGCRAASAGIPVRRSCLGIPHREPSKGTRHVDLPK